MAIVKRDEKYVSVGEGLIAESKCRRLIKVVNDGPESQYIVLESWRTVRYKDGYMTTNWFKVKDFVPIKPVLKYYENVKNSVGDYGVYGYVYELADILRICKDYDLVVKVNIK